MPINEIRGGRILRIMAKNKKILLIIIVMLVIGAILINAALSNKRVLFTIALTSDDPSSIRYFALERIYKLSQNDKFRKEILDELLKDDQKSLHSLFIRTLGVAGDKEVVGYLVKAYVDTQDDKSKRGLQHYIIDSMGLIGDESTIFLLRRLLENYDKHPIEVTQYAIARALYLQTGEKSYYTDSFGKKVTVSISEELLNARDVIIKSKDRTRTLEEMLTLDKIFRPPAIRGEGVGKQ